MYIKLTNANPNFINKPVLLKKDLIVSVYEGTVTSDDGEEGEIVENITYVFVPPHGEWQVQESVETILAMLNN
jgi:hypothetical protein